MTDTTTPHRERCVADHPKSPYPPNTLCDRDPGHEPPHRDVYGNEWTDATPAVGYTPLTPDQLTVRTVADFLNTASDPFHITPETAHAIGRLFAWHANLDSDETGDNEAILNAARAFDADHLVNAAGPIYCLGCLIEQHQGTRTTPNPAAAIVGGQSTCLEHLQFADSPLIPGRTPSGIILGNGS